MNYKILDHPADAKFKAEGENLEEAFSEAVKAFSEIVGGGAGKYHHEIEVESENLEALLFDFIDKLIFLQDTENVVVSHASEMSVEELKDGWKLKTKVLVDKISLEEPAMDLKAPTYSEMEVEYNKGEGWVVQAVIDI